MIGAVRRYRFTVDQYHRIGALGIIPPECRVELIDGQIFRMSPIGPWHSGVVNRLTRWFVTGLGERAVVHVQNPTIVDKRSEPQPDIMLLAPRADFYGTAHPTPRDTLLVVEVAETSLAHDRRRKLPLYARSGVMEAWIVDHRADAIDVFREPSANGYAVEIQRRRGDHVAPLAFPELRLAVSEVLGAPDAPEPATTVPRAPR